MLFTTVLENLFLSLIKSVFCIITFSHIAARTLNNYDIAPATSQNYIWQPVTNKLLNPVAERSKPWFCGYSPADNVGSKPAGKWMLCVTRQRSLRRADHSYRGFLPTVLCFCVWFRSLKNEEDMAVFWLQTDIKIITNILYCLKYWYYCVRYMKNYS
jgi:hypothetical protein